MKRVLITGSEGRISTRTLKPALAPHYDLVGFDLVLGDDLLDDDSLDRKLPGVDAVIHTAGIPGPLGADNAVAFDRVNHQGSRRLIERSKEHGVGTVIFFSSFARYGVDAWMRERYETGPVTGDDVAVPRYLPIDEDHPSVLDYDGLFEWGGKWYGESKARAEQVGASLAGESFGFVSLRLTGVRERSAKWVQRRRLMLEEASRGVAEQRKQWLYGTAGLTSQTLLVNTLRAVIDAEIRGFQAFNVTDATHGNHELTAAYFPENEPTDQIFATQKLRVFLNRAGYAYAPPHEPVVDENGGGLFGRIVRRRTEHAGGRR
jgi:nucleoside-diphosphate-sugar epimerase